MRLKRTIMQLWYKWSIMKIKSLISKEMRYLNKMGNENIKLIQGDCLEVMDDLIKQGVKVDCILTDPPYGISKKNNFETMGRSSLDFGEWDKCFNQTEYIEKAVKLLSQNGSIIIFNDWKNLGEISNFCETLDLDTKDMLRWEKRNPMPRNRDRRYITDYECAIWLVKKGSKWTFNRLNKSYQRPKFIYSGVKGKSKFHPTQKPVGLMEEILKIHSNEEDTVLDPFMGSGSIGVACKNLNRSFYGIELDEKYFKIAKERIFGMSEI